VWAIAAQQQQRQEVDTVCEQLSCLLHSGGVRVLAAAAAAVAQPSLSGSCASLSEADVSIMVLPPAAAAAAGSAAKSKDLVCLAAANAVHKEALCGESPLLAIACTCEHVKGVSPIRAGTLAIWSGVGRDGIVLGCPTVGIGMPTVVRPPRPG
jgi:hypothetical protein